jgi:cytochrome c oxidase subunit 3
LWLLATIVLGVIFVSLQLVEWSNKDFTPASHTYGSLFFVITGTHLAHVCVGIVALAFMLVWTLLHYFDAERHNVFTVGALYWHFVDVVWLFIFSSLYLLPNLGLTHGG